jgi:putative transposase
MSHSYNQIWIHAIWTTKYRNPLIGIDVENCIHQYLHEQYMEFGCPAQIINGMPDHVHSLFLLNSKQPIMAVLKQVKGASSYWINEENIIDEKFYWQSGYAAYSVSASQVQKVFQYIKNQKSHHRQQTTTQELNELIKRHGLMYDEII